MRGFWRRRCLLTRWLRRAGGRLRRGLLRALLRGCLLWRRLLRGLLSAQALLASAARIGAEFVCEPV